MDKNTINKLQNKIVSTYSDLYIGNFYNPLYDICVAYRDWLDSLDDCQETACGAGYVKQYFCPCERLDQKKAWNVALHLIGGRIKIELHMRDGHMAFVNVRTALADDRIEIPSFFVVAGVGSALSNALPKDTINGFVFRHFYYANGKYAKDLVDVKKLLEIDYAPLHKTIAKAMTDTIEWVNTCADELRDEKDKVLKSLMKDFGIEQEKKSYYKKVVIKVMKI